jgi:hypothetical protein
MTDQRLAEVSYARRGAAAWTTLDRPAKRNALTPVMVSGRGLCRAPRPGIQRMSDAAFPGMFNFR